MTKTATTDRVMTRHPAGKQGVHIARDKYEAMRKALLKVIPRRVGGIAFRELSDAVQPYLDTQAFPRGAKAQWYVVTVKQDLEARGEIEQVPGVKPQRVRRLMKGAR